ncbi:MAG: Wzt carbohydrate-binding domain-containing protein [Candidatus Omnitrophota bacterium]|jgi:ABC-type polysaccharide/polyol phosphate transport system ATPase subunit
MKNAKVKLMITSHTDSDSELSQPTRRATLELLNVGKRYAFQGKAERAHLAFGQVDFWALKDVSFSAFEGEALGIIGRNGAGKTTCLNVIAGVLSSTEGEVRVRGKVLGLFNLGVGFQEELSGRENIFLNGAILGAERKEIEEKLNSIIDFSELGKFIDMPLGSYSQGMRLRLAFSIMASLDFDLLVIDEVLAVGDILFQNKCFERLMDFKRRNKTLIFTSQGMDVIERFCDRVVCLDHGRLIFSGAVQEGINRYRELLNTKKFYVGIQEERPPLITHTKKWLDDIPTWEQVTGAKEATIDRVRFFARFHRRRDSLYPGEPLRVKIDFTVRDRIREPHFGVAFFRKDGVYCYGPNTEFDGYVFGELKKGKGHCIFFCPRVNLAPGEYSVSVAIWDKHEKIAYDYHNGCYKMRIQGIPQAEELLRLPYREKWAGWKKYLQKTFFLRKINARIYAVAEKDKNDIALDSVKCVSFDILDSAGEKRNNFFTNIPAEFVMEFSLFKQPSRSNGYFMYLGIYRDDGILCQRFVAMFNDLNKCIIEIPQLALLPGGYRISTGIWDAHAGNFLWLRNNAYSLQMIFDRKDHGTVYLNHKWTVSQQSDN